MIQSWLSAQQSWKYHQTGAQFQIETVGKVVTDEERGYRANPRGKVEMRERRAEGLLVDQEVERERNKPREIRTIPVQQESQRHLGEVCGSLGQGPPGRTDEGGLKGHFTLTFIF